MTVFHLMDTRKKIKVTLKPNEIAKTTCEKECYLIQYYSILIKTNWYRIQSDLIYNALKVLK